MIREVQPPMDPSIDRNNSSSPAPESRAFRLLRHVLQQFQPRRRDRARGVHLQVARSGAPGFVAAEGVLLWRGQVAVVAVGQLDREGMFQRALLFDLQADLDKGFAGIGDDAEFADADRLQDHLHLGSVTEAGAKSKASQVDYLLMRLKQRLVEFANVEHLGVVQQALPYSFAYFDDIAKMC